MERAGSREVGLLAGQRRRSGGTGAGLVVTLTTNARVYRAGEPIVMALRRSNPTDQEIAIDPEPALGAFFVTQKGSIIWRSPGGQPAARVENVVYPHRSIMLTATWNGQSRQAGPSARSSGIFQVHSEVPDSRPVTIEITPR